MDAAFVGDEHGGFDDDDWNHALGGVHFLREVDDLIVAHAAVVERELHVAGRPVRAGYVEAVATAPELQRVGHGTDVMREVNAYIDANFELGALGTGSQAFYERLGWKIWRGPSFVRTERGDQRTPDEDGYIMVLLTRSSPPIGLDEPISCDWRSGDVW
jgi:aminoglycoside 2'-N-acetyltransferase I